jgi:thymidylate kinase
MTITEEARSFGLSDRQTEDGYPALDLVRQLCGELDRAEVSYCHWKSNTSLSLSAAGVNDLDLLVAREHSGAFMQIIDRLGFKLAIAPRPKRQPGVFHAYALDRPSGRLVHIHGHWQLVIGDDMTKNYRLPIERAFLASATRFGIFRVPSAEMEYLVFVIRMVLKHSTWDAIACLQGWLSRSERLELEDLSSRADRHQVPDLVREHLPSISARLWRRCEAALDPSTSLRERAATAAQLQRELEAFSRRRRSVDTSLRVARRSNAAVRKMLASGPRGAKTLPSGGLLVGIVGGDGAGKSTMARELVEWLSRDLRTRAVHLGKPARSPLSLLGRSVGRAAVGRSKTAALPENASHDSWQPSYARLVAEVLTGRDRYRAYVRARRFVSHGGVVICDRFPLRELELMDSTPTSRAVARSSRRGLARYLAVRAMGKYRGFTYPDVLIVLRLDPDTAVARKRHEEPASFVRPRSEEVWLADWSLSPAVVIDAALPAEEVMARIKDAVWSRL